jgi:transporter family-2 protein
LNENISLQTTSNLFSKCCIWIDRIITHDDFISLSNLGIKIMSTRLLIWAALAGAFIPVMAILNGRLGRSIGESLHAPVILFSIGFVFCCLCSFYFTKSLPGTSELDQAKPIEFLGGFIVAFYVISATLLAPRIGVANFIVCAVSAQIITSVLIDNYGLLGATVRPVSTLRLFGIGLLLIGLVITQISDLEPTTQN